MIETGVAIFHHARGLGYRWVLPEVPYHVWYADWIAWGPRKGILEIEFKRSMTNARADARKVSDYRSHRFSHGRVREIAQTLRGPYHYSTKVAYEGKIPSVSKHEWLCGSYPCRWRPNYFVMAAPIELAEQIRDAGILSKSFGIWGVRKNGGVVTLRKMSRLCKLESGKFRAFEQAMRERAFNEVLNRMYNDIQRRGKGGAETVLCEIDKVDRIVDSMMAQGYALDHIHAVLHFSEVGDGRL